MPACSRRSRSGSIRTSVLTLGSAVARSVSRWPSSVAVHSGIATITSCRISRLPATESSRAWVATTSLKLTRLLLTVIRAVAIAGRSLHTLASRQACAPPAQKFITRSETVPSALICTTWSIALMAPCFQSFGSVSSSAIHQPARSLVSSAVAGRGASAPAASATAIVSRAAEWSDSDTRARRGHQKCSRWPLAI